MNINDAIAKARGIAAERGVSFDPRRPGGDPRLAGRDSYRRSRSRSRSPRAGRDSFRGDYNPYRDERRNDSRRMGRDRSFSPDRRGFSGGGTRSPPGRGGGGDESETIAIESNLVGLIIGKQGENLRRVEAKTQTRVQFDTHGNSGPMRQCKIIGTGLAREDAKAEIFRIISENGPPNARAALERMRAAQGQGKVTGHSPALREGEDATQIMVPNRTVGLIIGRGGETIRDLQDRSQCHVNIVGEEKSVNGLRPVNLIGTPQAAARARELIMEIVESDTKNLASQGGGGGQQNQGRDMMQQNGSDKASDSIYVPSEAVGMIIGKGGETIKDMQSTTGCKINVSPPNGRDIRREIGLVGSRQAIESAKRAIDDKVRAVVRITHPSHSVYNTDLKQREKNGGPFREESQQPYNDRYSSSQQPSFQQNQQMPSFPAPNQAPSQAPSDGQGAGGAADPYAIYGGYQNYAAMWYAHIAQQGGQQGQPPGTDQKPPGS